MRVIEGEDVNELYWRGMNMLRAEGRREDSRNGPVIVMPEPVTSTYRSPRQRVLLDLRRAANPFFHLYESLWMLAGRNDIQALNRYITDFGTRFAEPDGTMHGAYGHRWRRAFGFDQLDSIVAKLKSNLRDRQAVLQMWDSRRASCHAGECDPPLDKGWNDLSGDWKDRPCNTHVYFRVREDHVPSEAPLRSMQHVNVLDMMISCRSNDIVYGAYGANAVHFSILQEYVAGRVGVLVGKMEQVSWNYHSYEDVLGKVGVPDLATYKGHRLKPEPMVTHGDVWDADLQTFMNWHDRMISSGVTDPIGPYTNQWFVHTAEPMFLSHFRWKTAMQNEARGIASVIEATDWRFAAIQWYNTRTNARSR
jgi:thymidylate synthase